MNSLTEKEQKIFDLAYEIGYKCGFKDGEYGRIKLSSDNKIDNVSKIIEICCFYLGVTREEIHKKCRKREWVYARQMTMIMLVKYTQLSLKAIGEIFNGRDHSTVIHSRDAIHRLKQFNEEISVDYEYLTDIIKRIIVNNEDVNIEVKQIEIPSNRIWGEYYRHYMDQKKVAQEKVIQISEQAEVSHETKVVVIRPTASYSNRGHINLIKEYS